MILKDEKLDLDDLAIKPCDHSCIDSRSECIIYDDNGMLPVMTSPMFSVVDNHNIDMYVKNRIYPVLPRGFPHAYSDFIDMVIKENHVAFGLDSFIYLFMNEDGSPRREDCPRNVVIDMANGHMYKLCKVAETAKKHYPNMRLTVGNVASPETFENLCSVGVDGIRLGIGNGSVCTTSKKTGVFYPLGSLIQECADIKEKWDYHTDIIADGGFDSFPRIIKALGLGANRVMLGGMLNIALESAGTTRIGTCGEVIAPYSERAQKLFKDGVHLTKEYYGMSTHKAQRGIDEACILKPEEGYSMGGRKVQYTVEQLCESFGGALRSAMSYAGKRLLKDFIGGVDFIRVSGSAYARHEGNIHG